MEQLEGVLVFLFVSSNLLFGGKSTDNVRKQTLLPKMLPYCLPMSKRILCIFRLSVIFNSSATLNTESLK